MENNNSIVPLQYGGVKILVRESDGWINLSRLCKDNDKRFGNYLRLKQSQDEMGVLANQLGSESVDSILKIEDGRYGGTWGHPLLAVKVARWISPELANWLDARNQTRAF